MKILICLFATLLASSHSFAQQEASRAEIDQQLADFGTLINEARSVPEMKNGQIVGYKLSKPHAKNEKLDLIETNRITTLQTIESVPVTNEATPPTSR